MKLKIVTRESTLALAQTGTVMSALEEATGQKIKGELVPTKTLGDKYRHMWNEYAAENPDCTKRKWIFELEEAIAAREGDVAIHSGKDIPDTVHAETAIVSVMQRKNPFDLLIFKNADIQKRFIDSGEYEITVGTSSVRRAAALRRTYPGIRVSELRGNITTRVQKLAERDDLHAIVLASCGLERIGALPPHRQELDMWQMTPSMSQGVLVAQYRKEDQNVREALQHLVDRNTQIAWQVERSCVEALGVGCDTAFGIFCQVLPSGEYEVLGRGLSKDGQSVCEEHLKRRCSTVEQAQQLGQYLARKLKEKGIFETMQG